MSGDAVRLLQARQAQFHFASAHEKANEQVGACFPASALLAIRLAQRLPLNRRTIHSQRL